MAAKLKSSKRTFDLQEFLERSTASVNAALDRFLPTEKTKPATIHKAMRYSLFAGGKRMRPALVLASAQACGGRDADALPMACAVECIHTYSLVHDDLPAMDNDDLRRGQPTAHKKYDEATAILAGDGLLTFAFDILARDDTHPDPAVRGELILALARGAGLGGMVGGQMLDLAAEGRFDNGKRQSLDEQGVATLQAMKTGALLRFGSFAGGILARADAGKRAALDRYGDIVGKAFQIADDLLDVEGDTATLGKAAGKDAEAGKATLVAVLGIDKAKARLKSLVDEAEAALKPFGAKAAVLAEAARFVAERKA